MAVWDWVLLAWFFIVGMCVGSFLNVVVYRLPRGGSLLRPASRCPACEHPIRPWDNIPILSWIFLQGRCRDCDSKINWRYPLVEFTVGIWFACCSTLALTANPTVKVSSWTLSVLLAFFGAAFLSASLIVQDGKRVPRLIQWLLLVGVCLIVFMMLIVISG